MATFIQNITTIDPYKSRRYSNTVWVSEDSTPPTDTLYKKPPRGFFKKRTSGGGDFARKKGQNKSRSHGDSKVSYKWIKVGLALSPS